MPISLGFWEWGCPYHCITVVDPPPTAHRSSLLQSLVLTLKRSLLSYPDLPGVASRLGDLGTRSICHSPLLCASAQLTLFDKGLNPGVISKVG